MILCGCGGVTQSTMQLGASYDHLQFTGLGGEQVSLAPSDCQANLCSVTGSAQGAGQYTLSTGSTTPLTLTSEGGDQYTVAGPSVWSLQLRTDRGSLAGEISWQSARDRAASGELTLQGQLQTASGSLAGLLPAGTSISLLVYDGAGLASLLGNTNSVTASVAPGSLLSPASSPVPVAVSAPNPPAAPPLDAYGGLSGFTAGVGTGFFHVQKVQQRWVLVDPLGHPLWLLGVFAVDTNTDTSAGTLYTLGKYGSRSVWGLQAVRRLRAWGFNSTAEYSSAYVVPVTKDGSYETTEPMPWVDIMRPSYYSLRDTGAYAPAPVKDLVAGLDSVYTNYRGDTLPDVFDPNFAVYANASLAAQTNSAVASSSWLIGTAVDDLDDLWGFGPGPDLPAARSTSNIGWIALCTDFQQTANASLGQLYTDPEVYTKYALANWLQTKYGSVAALNQAWGSAYSSFGDDGGYGSGTGLLDEDGHDPWVGNDDVALSGASAAVKADLNAFLALFAQKYFSIVSGVLRQQRPNQLVFGPCTLNAWNGISRAGILAAAGQYTDVIQASMANQQVYDLSLSEAGDHPFVTWTGMPANPDSDLSAYPNPDSPNVYLTQAARGAAYAAQVEDDFAYSGPAAAGDGSQNVIGSKFWAWTDSWGEQTNWGLVSFLDNAYDGVEDSVAPGQDAWGYNTGGEAADYGDFLTLVQQANAAVLVSLAAALGQ